PREYSVGRVRRSTNAAAQLSLPHVFHGRKAGVRRLRRSAACVAPRRTASVFPHRVGEVERFDQAFELLHAGEGYRHSSGATRVGCEDHAGTETLGDPGLETLEIT